MPASKAGSAAEKSTPGGKRSWGIDVWSAELVKRREHLLTHLDFTRGRGLEVGPLDSAVADPSTTDVRFVDVLPTAGLIEHYGEDPNVIVELIPEVDYPLHQDGRVRSLADAAAPGAPYDWVIASHVIEHVPDVIGWLSDLASVTVDGGALLLIVPDRRYCFDRHRPPTTVGQALQAHEECRVRPPVGAVYDALSAAVAADAGALWKGRRPPGRDGRVHDLDYVCARLEEVRAGEYVDCHVWTWTPDSLLEQIREWRALGYCEWYLESVEEMPGTVEFHTVLRRIPRDADLRVTRFPEPELMGDLPDWLLEEWTSQKRARTLERQNAALRAEVHDLRSSARMRVGTILVTPLARARDHLRRRSQQ